MTFIDRNASPDQPMVVRATQVRQSPNTYAEAGFVFIVTMVALAGFATTFDSLYFLVVSAIGVALGILIAYGIRALSWNWSFALVGAVAAYFLAGGTLALRQDLVGGFLPSWSTENDLAKMAIDGWKQFLTTQPPIDGNSRFLALVFLLALVFSAAAYSLTRTRFLPAGLIPEGILFILVIALGTQTPVRLAGLAWVVSVVAWMAYRAHARGRAPRGGRIFWTRVIAGVVLMGLAAAAGWGGGPHLWGVDPPREILRDQVESPVDMSTHPSPMPSLRKYSSSALADTYFYDKELMNVEGAQPGDLVRFAVLDSYDGLVWGAGNGSFRTVGTQITPVVDGAVVAGTPVDLTITIGDVYASQAPLSIWIPSLGYATQISFEGSGAGSHMDSMAYDMGKGQGVILDQFQAGDVVHVRSIRASTDISAPLVPSGPVLVSSARTEFLAGDLSRLTGGAQPRWDELMSMAEGFRQGGWTDGTTRPDESRYVPGDGQGRLTDFLATWPNYIGSDEQYAAVFALAANRIGFPARVVFGAKMPDAGTSVQGKDVTIWVEVHTINGWVAISPDVFIPPRDQAPQPPPPVETEPPQSVPDIAPANPKLPPDDLNGMEPKNEAGTTPTPNLPADQMPEWVKNAVIVTVVVAGLVLLVLAFVFAKSIRSRWRHERGTRARQIAGGWADALDRARDVGVSIPRGTPQEQAHALESALLMSLADFTDRAMFQAQPPDQEIVDAYWAQVDHVKDTLLKQKKGIPQLWARITPRSLIPLRR